MSRNEQQCVCLLNHGAEVDVGAIARPLSYGKDVEPNQGIHGQRVRDACNQLPRCREKDTGAKRLNSLET
eukprot:scaffold234397_cov33-Tisochrysis_lutea.AAC.2